jgi:pimeloyl-ACP methyl ester carboxylesterase
MPFVETGTGALHYHVCDVVAPWIERPRTIVFHHGIAASIHIWIDWLPLLAQRYRLVRFDMRGFGESVRPDPAFRWTFDGLTADLLRVADAAGAKEFHLVGESIGGTAALACALHEPKRVLSLTMSNAAARGGLVGNVSSWRDTLRNSGQRGWADEMMQRRFHPHALAPDAHEWYRQLHETCFMDATLALADMLLEADLTARLGEIQVPTLLLSPDASPFIPAEVMAAMRALIPKAELQVFAHSKHGLPFSHGSQCARVLEAFLERNFGN